MESLEIEVDVNEAYINRVQPGQKAQAVLDAYPDWTIPAHVIAIIPTADRSKATVKVRIGIDQKDPRILPDMGVRVSFLEADAAEAGATGAASAAPRGVLVPRIGRRRARGAERGVRASTAAARARARSAPGAERPRDLRLVEGTRRAAPAIVRAPPPNLRDGAAVAIGKQ